MKIKAFLTILILTVLCIVITLGYVSAASISATINATVGGSPVTTASQGSTIQLQCSFTIDPVDTADAVVQYRYSADGITWGSKTTITTLSSWDGSTTYIPFTLTNSGSYRFFLTVEAMSGASATALYPSTGTFSSSPVSVLPESSSSVVAMAISLAAICTFIVVTKKKSQH
jgi:hypothetical protein